jgi:cation:H+ antiporter
MSDALLMVAFFASAIVSLGTSWLLVSRLERIGARLGLSEALLGVLAAVAADSPEITAAVTAITRHEARIGAGVVIGSNVFNLAALLGLAAVIAGGIALHRRVVLLEGTIALWVATVCLTVVVGAISAAVGLAAVLVVLGPYLLALGVRRSRLRRLGLPAGWVSWLANAIGEEELELEGAIHPSRGRRRDALVAAVAVLIVVGASVAMERAASTLGRRHGIPEIVVGGLILAAVTSLPNAVAAIYLARRERGAATLSTAMNSNALNVAVGLLLPAVIVGFAAESGGSTLAAAWYAGLTAFALAAAYIARGLRRIHGALILCAYLAFVGLLLSGAYGSSVGSVLSIVVPTAAAILLAARLLKDANGGPTGPTGEQGSGREPEPAVVDAIMAITQRHRMAADDAEASANGHQPEHAAAGDESLLAGWSVRRIWVVALAITSFIAVIDAALGPHLVLIGLLIAGPCCALLTGRWGPTATASGWAIALAIVLGLPDGIWGTRTHLVFAAAVVIVAIVSTSSAAVIERRR